ncbi:GNAT family N-acetyltransferase [Brevibacillus ginsengisoli]|uniref:GNAT family N-acetyltransferase n=1 Tax=Brevibacillus ginsengisoli TaxID=363854 RepID=UPI003CF83FB9
MAHISIRNYRKTDEEEVLNIGYRTGYMGEDLTEKQIFNDKRLFGYLFCLYYTFYEEENCFVAVDESNGNKVVGYVLGTNDSRRQEIRFALTMAWRIVLRLTLYTIWKHPESFQSVIFLLRNIGQNRVPDNLYEQYPAHLHINVLPEYQSFGIGSLLISQFEKHLQGQRVPGVHLRTSNNNQKAIPFYHKKGYSLLYEEKVWLWKNTTDTKILIFAKKLD